MRQVWITKAGPPDVLEAREAPVPSPLPGEARIAVAAIGVNFADIMGRLGLYREAPPIPYIPGYEVAGRIDAVGREVDETLVGTDVIALLRSGGYSEYVCVPVEQTLPRPANLSPEQAAGLPVAFLTAYEALVVLGGIKPGERVLIHAAAGGLGLAAVEIAKLFSATIYGTSSPQKHDFLRARGVQFPIDYRNFGATIRRLTDGHGVQIALDTIGGRSWVKSYRALAPGGRLVLCGMSSAAPGQRRSLRALVKFALFTPWLMFNPVRLTSDNKGVAGINMGTLWDELAVVRTWAEQVLVWVEAGKLDVRVDRTFPLEDAAEAHRYIQARQNRGKVILVP
jgi:NADPH:quinone reductase-like Zn-dependent oxidoreductase